MRRIFLMLLAAGIVMTARSSSAATVGIRVSSGNDAAISFFYDSLRPYGDWVMVQPYGMVWSPYNVSVGWRPYSEGHWVYTNWGWTWVSDQSWGWACFHYGRWYFSDDYGWVWIPDTVWAPAWVCWRTGPGWIGWAPLPPDARWHRSGFGRRHIDYDAAIRPDHYCFTTEDRFLDDEVGRSIVLPARNVGIVRQTKTSVDYMINKNTIVNRLPVDIGHLQQATGRKISQYDISDADRAGKPAISGNHVLLYRPDAASGKAVYKEPPTSPAPTGRRPDIIQRQQQEAQQLQDQQKRDRQTLIDQQTKEAQQPPKGVSNDELNRRHAAEQQTLNKETTEQQKQLNTWQRRERVVQGTPDAPPPRKYNLGQQDTGKSSPGQQDKKGQKDSGSGSSDSRGNDSRGGGRGRN